MNGLAKVYSAVFIVVILAASALVPGALWGAGAWYSVSFTACLVLAITLLPAFAAKPADRLTNLISGGTGTRNRMPFVLFPALAVILWLLRPGHLLLGGIGDTVSETAAGAWSSPASPLGSAFTEMVFRALNSLFFISPRAAVAAASVVMGLLFIAAAASIARRSLPEGEGGSRAWMPGAAVLAAGGYSVVFFGGDSTVAAGVLTAALFIAAAASHIRGRTSIVTPAALFALASATYLPNLFLAPGVFYLAARPSVKGRSRNDALAALAGLVLALAAFDLTMSFISPSTRPSQVVAQAARQSFGAVLSSAPGTTFADWGNMLLVLGPPVILALASLFVRRGGSPRPASFKFHAVNTLSGLVMVLLLSSLASRGLRWEVFAPVGLAAAVMAVVAIDGMSPAPRAARACMLLFLLSLFHLTPLVLAGASRGMGTARLQSLPLAPGTAERLIGLDLMASEDYEGAAEWLGRSIELAPEDAPTLYALGKAEMEEEEFLDAISHFNRALKISPDEAGYRLDLGEAYIGQRWYEEASREFEKLVAGHPENIDYLERLGYVYNHGGWYDKAVETYEKVLSTDVGNMQYRRNLASALLNLGASHHEKKEYEEAEEAYRRVMALIPLSWVARNNLAMIYMDKGDYEEAYAILEEALESNEVAPKLHYNMALVQEKRGNYDDALYHIKRSIELSPGVPAPDEDMQRIWSKTQEDR